MQLEATRDPPAHRLVMPRPIAGAAPTNAAKDIAMGRLAQLRWPTARAMDGRPPAGAVMRTQGAGTYYGQVAAARQENAARPEQNATRLHGAGAPEEIRTPDPQIRSLVLYPAELRALVRIARKGSHAAIAPRNALIAIISSHHWQETDLAWRPPRRGVRSSSRGRALTEAYINRIATGVPPHDVHAPFVRFAETLFDGERQLTLFQRMAERAGIEHRFSYLAPRTSPAGEIDAAVIDGNVFYRRGGFPDTATRMRAFEAHAPALAAATVERLQLGSERDRISHLLITCCTGFSAPGLDLEVVARCKLPGSVERTMIGFMGCYAAINALKLARHIVRSEPDARVLVLNLELCTLHFQETSELEQVLCFLLFGDGCAACLVTSEPRGIALDSFRAVLVPDTGDLITWHIREFGFDMVLSGRVPGVIRRALRGCKDEILGGAPAGAIGNWAVHPGGSSILDAVERAFDLAPAALVPSREVLRRYGNTSSASVMFVLERLLRSSARGSAGCAMAFGPGLITETMLFRAAA
jgi:alpha-pyrone synthase